MIRFSDRQWDRVIANHRKWWKGELGRPLLPFIIHGADPGRPEPKNPSPHFRNCADWSVTPEAMIDRMDYDLSSCEFYGDSFPVARFAFFGPGVIAAFLGATLEPADNTVWFHLDRSVPITDLHLAYDEGNIWLNRLKDIYRAGMKKWGGNVCIAMTDLGGNLDILASLLGTEGLLYECLDHPEEVKRLCGEITSLWQRFFWELTDIVKGQRVFSDWSHALAEKPSYILQSDFSYMISPELFKEFIHEDLSATSAVLDKPYYHLDGIGEIKHLDDILSIETISGIQWVPGAGEPETRDWSGLYHKISSQGKKIMAAFRSESSVDALLKVIKKPDDLMCMRVMRPMKEKEGALAVLDRYGAV